MDFFKKRAREILMNDQEREYSGKPYKLDQAYKYLKQAIKNPLVVHTTATAQPGYLKATFTTCRNAKNGDRFL